MKFITLVIEATSEIWGTIAILFASTYFLLKFFL